MRRALVALFVVAAALAPAASSAQTDLEEVLLILDASGSMNQVTGSGERLIDEAKDALREIVVRLPGDAEVGLRVYGHRTSNDDPVAGCADSELVVPVAPIDRDQMLAAIDGFDASGFTPIGLSLQEAAQDLGDDGGTIILVSDGEDTCAPPDPCEVARELAEEGFVTRVHTVGLLLQDPAAVDQLQCIAGATGGRFVEIGSVDGLLEELSGLVTGAIEGPGRVHPFIEGALSIELAPSLEWFDGEVGWFETFLEGSIATGETRWWGVDVDQPGYHIAFNASVDWQPDADPDEYIELQIFDESGTAIGERDEVLGVIVSNPQRLLLRDAADFGTQFDLPTVTAVTDARSMFPAWEADQEWFRPTVERFAAAGLNGGLYHMWKTAVFEETLVPGRYYLAVRWDGAREATSPVSLIGTMYRADDDASWQSSRPIAATSVLDDAIDGVGGLLEPIPGEDETYRFGALGIADRSIEVWAPVVDESPLEYSVVLDEGEWLLIGLNVSLGICCGGGGPEVSIVDPDGYGLAEDPDFQDHHGYERAQVFRARAAGEHTISVEVGVDPAEEPAMALAVHVFSAALASSDQVEEPDSADLRARAENAIQSGLEAVRTVAGAGS